MQKKLSGFGINVDINHFDTQSIDVLIGTILKLKAKWVRVEVCSNKYQNKQKLNILRLFCTQCVNHDILVVGLLSDFIPMTLNNLFTPQKKYAPIMGRLEQYADFVKSVVAVLKKHISHWELWNEQNSKRFWNTAPSPQEYTQFLKKLTLIIQRTQPQAKIIFGGVFGNDITPIYPFTPTNILYGKGFIEQSIQHGADQYVNYYSIHPYTRYCYFSIAHYSKILLSITERIAETRKYYAHLPLIISEIGVSPVLNPRAKSSEIARIYTHLIKYCENLKIPICIYILADQHNSHYSSINPDNDFGFLDYDLKPKALLHEFLKLQSTSALSYKI